MREYVAQFSPDPDREGAWCVDFPQLEGCFTEGDTLGEAMENARECLASYLEAACIEDEECPAPLSPEETRALCEAGGACPAGAFYHAVLSLPLEEK